MVLLYLLLVGILLDSVVCDSSDFCPVSSRGVCGLGQAFFVPSLSVVEDSGNGVRIYENIGQECLRFVPSNINKEEKDYFEDANNFFSKLGSQTGLSRDVSGGFTLGASLDAASNFMDYKQMKVKGASMDVISITGFWDFVPECLNTVPLTEEFRSMFESLPSKVDKPHLSSHWYRYDALLRDYGTHIINRISYGSKFTKYTFSKSTEEASTMDLLIKTCASLNDMDIGVCGGFTDEDYNKVKSLSTSEQMIARGGTPETRAKIMVTLTNDVLKEFMKEANATDQPVSQKFTSIWSMLKKRYLGTEHYQKAISLEAYYKGYLAGGCSYKIEDEVELRKFILVDDDPNVPGYECQLAPRGCRGDMDCHHGYNGPCYCYGPGCVASRPRADGRHSIEMERFIKDENLPGSAFYGVNKSCKINMGLFCTCDKGWGGNWETVWPDREYAENIKLMREAYRNVGKFYRK